MSLGKSQEAIWPSVEPRIPLRGPHEACFNTFLMLHLVGFFQEVGQMSKTDTPITNMWMLVEGEGKNDPPGTLFQVVPAFYRVAKTPVDSK